MLEEGAEVETEVAVAVRVPAEKRTTNAATPEN